MHINEHQGHIRTACTLNVLVLVFQDFNFRFLKFIGIEYFYCEMSNCHEFSAC